MELEQSVEIHCPHCGEMFTTFVDLSAGESNYIEDCQVCCRPMTIQLTVHDLENEDFSVDVQSVDA